MKRSPIPKELRPEISGSKLAKIKNNSIIAADKNSNSLFDNYTDSIISIGSLNDGTLTYFNNYCRSQGERIKKVNLENIEDVFSICKYIENNLYNDKLKIFFRYAEHTESTMQRMIAYLTDILSLIKGSVVNRPLNTSLNVSKPLQLSVLSKLNHNIATIPYSYIIRQIENDQNMLKQYIVKSISSTRSTVSSALLLQHQNTKSKISCPVMLQRLINGTNIRIHVVGKKLIAYKIHTNRLDYRTDRDIEIQSIKVPDEISAWCLSAVNKEGLQFAGIDFMITNENVWVLFEVNPTPAYHFYEKIAIRSGESEKISFALLEALKSQIIFANIRPVRVDNS